MFDLRVLLLAVVVISLARPAIGADSPKIETVQTDVIADLEKQRAPIFLSSCILRDDTADIVWFTFGKREGNYVEFMLADGDELNWGGFLIKRRSIDQMDLMGGIYTQTYSRKIIRDLLQSPFKLVPRRRIRAAFFERPHKRCVPPPATW
jgi:hypothetical protein